MYFKADGNYFGYNSYLNGDYDDDLVVYVLLSTLEVTIETKKWPSCLF